MHRRIDVFVVALFFTAAALLSCSHKKEQVINAPIVAAKSELKKSPAEEKLNWVLAVINEEQEIPSEKALENHFAPSFLEAVPASQLTGLFKQLQLSLPPVSIEKIVSKPDEHKLEVQVATAAEPLKVSITVNPDSSLLITGLLFKPVSKSVLKPLDSFSAVENAIKKDVESAQLFVAEVKNDKCMPVYEYNAQASFALGSTFKLWVLDALLDAIEKETLDWESTLAAKTQWRSFSADSSYDDGKSQSVQMLADKMISVSDNTATDILFYTIGRTQVEKSMKKFAQDSRLPMISTRELFIIKLAMDQKARDEFNGLSEIQKRRQLGGMEEQPLPEMSDALKWEKPIDIDKIEWFAKPNEICQTLASLEKRGSDKKLEPVLEILSKKPGVSIDSKRFPWVGFKGGSEPGVMYLAYLLKRDDGRLFSVITAHNDTQKPVDGAALVHATEQLIAVVGEHE